MTVDERLMKYGSQAPQIDPSAWVSRQAYVDGDVVLGPNTSVFPMSVLRGDIHQIRVGAGSNIQDGVIVHLADDYGVEIGEDVTIGHGAIVHACRIGDGCLIGMGATLLDGSVIGEGSIIGARALVPLNMEVPPYSLVVGLPGKVVRPLREEERNSGRELARKYQYVARFHREREQTLAAGQI